MTAGKATMGREVGKRMRERLTFELSGGAVVRLERFVSVTSVHAVFDVESSAHLHNHQVSADYFEGTHAPKAAG